MPRYLRFVRAWWTARTCSSMSAARLAARLGRGAHEEGPDKRVLGRAGEEGQEEAYETFWADFGPVLKEGLSRQREPREAPRDRPLPLDRGTAGPRSRPIRGG
jgi:HSP90 family molecular chaperone